MWTGYFGGYTAFGGDCLVVGLLWLGFGLFVVLLWLWCFWLVCYIGVSGLCCYLLFALGVLCFGICWL